ncbi:MerR family transcriptional regulator [Streptomyces niveus]|jgi:hypothetical protein|uniref:MerR family transcriptional regulator n=1 Tax=Streptomyces niveus TaxID=193462 RepID=UPI0037191237
MSTYRISQLAERSGVPATTLRFYEDAGLLPAGRTPAGYRVYGQDAVERLGFISSAKLLGLALEEIREEIPDGLRLSFPATPDLAGRLAALAAAEQDCCSFYDFTLHLSPTTLELTVRAPGAAAPLLGELFGVTA